MIFICMGRKKKYKTKEEQLEAQRRWMMEYYERNKEKLKQINLKRYHDGKRK